MHYPRKFGTPRENCILVSRGFETQQRLMWTKVTFLVITYIFTFVGSIAHGIRQLRIFDPMDSKQKAMKDYSVILTGLELTGDGNWEEKLTEKIAAETGEKVLGVSICWSWKHRLMGKRTLVMRTFVAIALAGLV